MLAEAVHQPPHDRIAGGQADLLDRSPEDEAAQVWRVDGAAVLDRDQPEPFDESAFLLTIAWPR